MEIPGSSGAFGQLETAQAGAGRTRLQALAEQAGKGQETREGLEKAAKEFEGVFLNELMKAMRRTVPENTLFNSQGATKFYRQMYDQEIARSLASGRGGVGIADLIVQQFEQNLPADDDAAGAASTAPAANPRAPAGPPAPPAPERQGPPAPAPVPTAPAAAPATPTAPAAAAARYRALDETAERTAALARLRLLAGREGTAAADTLGRYEADLSAASRHTDVPPALLLAVVMQESGGDADARSAKGAHGLMQLMPATAGEVGVSDPADPAQNLKGGATYLAKMLDRYDGRLDLALAAYNAGPGAVDRAGRQVPDYPETRRYVREVLDRYRRLGGGTELAIAD